MAIVGSGYTGLRAALTLARAGRSVAVFDKERPGYGASRRNAGFLGRTLKKSYVDLKAAKGVAYATAIYRDLRWPMRAPWPSSKRKASTAMPSAAAV